MQYDPYGQSLKEYAYLGGKQVAMRTLTGPGLDSDGDGMPDTWELQYGLNPFNAADASQDPDGDGYTSLQEYLYGRNPLVKETPVNTPAALNATAPTGVLFSTTLTASGGTPPYTWAITTGSLPPGLNLASGGTLSGIPTVAGAYNFTFTVTDSLLPASTSASALGTITVTGAAAVKGDLNSDGIVDVADVALAERIALGLIAPTASQLANGDVAPPGSPDGKIDAADVERIRRKALGLENF